MKYSVQHKQYLGFRSFPYANVVIIQHNSAYSDTIIPISRSEVKMYVLSEQIKSFVDAINNRVVVLSITF